MNKSITEIAQKAMHMAEAVNAILSRCESCGKDAEIFQTVGTFCCECWQIRIHPDI